MNTQEFLATLESEGIPYAFSEYGLSEKDLDKQEGPFFEIVKEVAAAYRQANRLAEPLELMIEGWEQ